MVGECFEAYHFRKNGECIRGVVVEGDVGGVVCMGIVCPGVLVRLGECRAVLLGVKGVWGNGLRGGGVRVVLLEELGGFTVCVWGVVWVCVKGEVVWRGEFGLCWLRWGLGVG